MRRMARPRLHDDDAVLDAAAAVTLELGARGASIDAIAARSGAPVGSIYHRFGSRDGVLAAAWERAVRRFQAGYLPDELPGPDPLATAAGMAEAVVGYAIDDPDGARLLMTLRPEDHFERPTPMEELNAGIAGRGPLARPGARRLQRAGADGRHRPPLRHDAPPARRGPPDRRRGCGPRSAPRPARCSLAAAPVPRQLQPDQSRTGRSHTMNPWPRIVTDWGSDARDHEHEFDCDEVLPESDMTLYRAIDVEAPAAVTYRWLCQMRVAPYSYDKLDNGGRQSPQELIAGPRAGRGRPALDGRSSGSRRSSPAAASPCSRRARSSGSSRSPTWSSRSANDRSRLVVKIRGRTSRDPLGLLMRLILPPGDLVMMRRQLLNLAELAERTPASAVAAASNVSAATSNVPQVTL